MAGERQSQGPGKPADVRNRLRRQVEEERVAAAGMERLLGVEGGDALYRAVARLKTEHDALRRQVAEGVTPTALEAVVLYLDEAGIRHVSPRGRQTARAAWDADLDPHEVIVDAVAELGLTPFMVHSTSWRVVDRQILLTFLVAVEPPIDVPVDCEVELVTRAELARGRATGPPPVVHLPQIVEHGLRHLAWLLREDEAIHEALADWGRALRGYDPEPFRAFGREPGA